ncbi:SOS response-associated peptidase [Aliikangiella coralliicola]|uniref:Abasic site processing protein n=1 Tax=Aliikangiella coralliicola TaxID=2592383 RepID=A0A545U0B3_9GAMM|nr:SOS response-associated peptidase [Aliikangiella coralliicola]TQV82873.1 SOS response-associated peptidase [Aliikangiella coralliicola]
MCGRYTLTQRYPDLKLSEIDDLIIENDYSLYNIAPSDSGLVIIEQDGEIVTTQMRWGFRPYWAKPSFAKINAKSETMFEGKMFKHSAFNRRCLVVADGFFEPKGPSGGYRPWYYFSYEDKRPFVFAGIWTAFETPEESYNNFAILTTSPNSQMEAFHHRAPVILNDHHAAWLDTSNKNVDDLKAIVAPTEYPGLVAYRVPEYAKKPGDKDEHCIEYVEDEFNTIDSFH